jgi:hypothetical protein
MVAVALFGGASDGSALALMLVAALLQHFDVCVSIRKPPTVGRPGRAFHRFGVLWIKGGVFRVGFVGSGDGVFPDDTAKLLGVNEPLNWQLARST